VKRQRPRRPRDPRAIDANRLASVSGSGVAVPITEPTPFERQMQHNEILVRWQADRPRRTP
jgi:hypothetical protein